MSDPDHTSQGERFISGIGVCMLRDHTSQRVRFVTGIGVFCCEITHHGGTYDLLRASACVCCEITHHKGCVFTGIGVCML